TLDLSLNGGTPGFTYLWNTGATTEDLYNIPPGGYGVTVTDANGCFETDTVYISGPEELNSTVTGTNILCFGGAGFADLTISGGTIPYLYLWSNDSTSQDINIYVPGTYYVDVTDSNGCQISDTITIAGPAEAITPVISGTNNLCYGDSTGSVEISVTGGTSPYSYLWDNSATSTLLSGLSAGTYYITVTDNNDCKAYDSITLSSPPALALSDSSITGDCGLSNGTAIVIVSGGTEPYSYLWDTSAGSQTLAVATGLDQGTYNVTVTDNNGCTGSLSVFVDCDELCSAYISDSTHVLCAGDSTGQAVVTMINGISPYTYLWNTGDTIAEISGIPAGNYIVTVTDGEGCSDLASVTILDPEPIIISVTAFDADCYGNNTGLAVASASGGTGEFSYLWSLGGETNDTITGLSEGVYTVIVMDANFCNAYDTVEIGEPELLTVNTGAVSHVRCHGGSDGVAETFVQGGASPYHFEWSDTETGSTAVSLAAGTNYVTITDANGCQAHNYVIITEPLQIDFSYTIDPTSCTDGTDGSISLSAEYGTPPYSYSVTSVETNEVVGTDTLTTDLAAGFYEVLISDSNLCILIDTLEVTAGTGECIFIPTVFTPNNDNTNDKWEITGIQFYDNVKIEVYNRWGDLVFRYDGTGIGYADPSNRWDGYSLKGTELPHASYVYIVNIFNGKKPYNGVVTIVK
ncbi:MAG: gliding motility-associated C-terminal domain-containing protein, partial [Bacteroidetes bacterium]|nr:gliding motility-associated C-terminal domain-containing protein [Bacteroidota bacterium]